jgi:hypothetical protein
MLEIQVHTPEAGEQQRPRLERLGIACGKVALWAAGSGIAGLAAMTMVPTQADIGPHSADITLTTDESAVFDLEPIGSIIKPLDSSLPFGLKIEVKENPGVTSAVTEQTEFSKDDIEDYARMFTSFEDDVDDAKQALIADWLRLSGVMGLAGYGIYRLPDKARREHLYGNYVSPLLSSRAFRYASAAALMMTTFSYDSVSKLRERECQSATPSPGPPSKAPI